MSAAAAERGPRKGEAKMEIDVETENQILSIGDEFLPELARRVRDGGEATPEYWEWLRGQVSGMERERERAG